MASADEELDRIRGQYGVDIEDDNADKLRRLETESSSNEDFGSYLKQIEDKQRERASSNAPSKGGGGGGGNDVTSSWNMADPMRAQAEADAARNRERVDALYGTLLGRSQQGLQVDRNDPNIRMQADAFAANDQRASREYIADIAERAGPTANIQGEKRLASERLGQRTGTFEAELIGGELSARRNEIAQALTSMGNMLSGEQTQQLTRELAVLDAAIKEQQNATVMRGQDLQNDQFGRQLGLNEWDRMNYWDYANTYGL